MSTEKTNSEALCALENVDFALAQKLLRENIKTGDHRAINNLGIFYIEKRRQKHFCRVLRNQIYQAGIQE